MILLDKELAIPKELVLHMKWILIPLKVNKIFTNHKIGLEPTYTQEYQDSNLALNI
jgi:hypothetical protein